MRRDGRRSLEEVSGNESFEEEEIAVQQVNIIGSLYFRNETLFVDGILAFIFFLPVKKAEVKERN